MIALYAWNQALSNDSDGRRTPIVGCNRLEQMHWLVETDNVLSLREGELESRLRDRERTQATLEAQLQELTLLLKKEQATRESQARRIAALEDQISARPPPPPPDKPKRSRSQTQPPSQRQPKRAARPKRKSTKLRKKAAAKPRPESADDETN